MKKFLAVLFVAAAFVAGAFALDLDLPETDFALPAGSFIDENWAGEWVISADLHIVLKDAKTGEVIYDFTDDKISNIQKSVDKDNGFVYSFECAETERRYYFSKPLTLNTNIMLEIDPQWTTENYKVQLTLKK